MESEKLMEIVRQAKKEEKEKILRGILEEFKGYKEAVLVHKKEEEEKGNEKEIQFINGMEVTIGYVINTIIAEM